MNGASQLPLVSDRVSGRPALKALSTPAAAVGPNGYARRAALGAWAAGLVFLLATFVDFATLWVLQRQPSPQWELVAVNQTLEGLPRLFLALAFLYLALFLGRSTSLLLHRVLALALVGVGLAGLAMGALVGTTYFALVGAVPAEAVGLLRSAVFKSVSLGGLYGVVGVPLGILGLRRPASD